MAILLYRFSMGWYSITLGIPLSLFNRFGSHYGLLLLADDGYTAYSAAEKNIDGTTEKTILQGWF